MGKSQPLTVKELAETVGYSGTRIRQLIDSGELKAKLDENYKGGGRKPWIIDRSSASRFIARLGKPKEKVPVQ